MKQLAIVVSILLCWTTIRAQETSLTYSQVARIGRGHIARIHWSPDGEEIAVASYRGVWFYSVDNMRQGARLFAPAKLNTDRPGAIVLDADWSHVAGFNADGDISVWDINNGVETQTLTDVPFVASHLAFSPDGARLAVAGKSGFGLYNLIDRSWQYTILFAEVDERYRDDLGTIIAEIAFVSDGEIIGITTTDTYVDEVNLKLYLFTQDDGEFLRNRYYNYDETVDLLGDEFPASGLMTRVITQRADFNRDGRAETYFRALFIYDNTGEFLTALPTLNDDNAYDSNRRYIAFSPDATRIAIAEPPPGGMLRVWGIQETIENPPCLLAPPTGSTTGGDIAPDMPGLSVCDPPWSARITQTDAHRTPLVDHTIKTYRRDGDAYVSLDGRWRLFADSRHEKGPIILENSAGEQTGLELASGDSSIRDVVFSPNGQRLFLYADMGTCPRDCPSVYLYVWDISDLTVDPEPLASALAHNIGSGFSASIAFSPDATRLVTTGFGNAAHVWDAFSLELLAVLPHATSLRSAAFGEDHNTVITTGRSGLIYVWQAVTD